MIDKCYIAHATSDEKGNLTGGTPGDQTGNEVKIQEWYNRPWTRVLRCKNTYNRALISKAMVEAARNDKIGYCQGHRRSLYELAKNVGYQMTRIEEYCECDCSSLVAVACMAAGYKINPDVYTGNLEAALVATGDFDVYTDTVHCKISGSLIPGDILLYPGHHTAVVVGTTNKVDIAEGWYYDIEGWKYFEDQDHMNYNGFRDINGHRYLFVDGVMQKGLVYNTGKWYFFEPSPTHPLEGALYLTDKFGCLEIGDF